MCYTDGSRINDQTGAGMMIQGGPNRANLNQHEAFHLGKLSTVFQAEIFAVSKTAEALLRNKLEGKKILINCDSKSAIQAINSTVIRNKTTLTATSTLNALSRNNEVTLRWIPAHSGYEGNETADKLAKAGAINENDSATCVQLPVPRCICYAALRSKTKEDWKSSYESNPPRTFNMFW
ncbi:MAG: reverse transcriptase-like protein [Gammaproteobacteria bacterium]|nr:reverse transcriptase-like protein [Gammaproteobacteria bacterium]